MLQVLLQVLCRLVRFSLQTGITFWFTIITIILNSPFQPPSLRNRNGGCFYLSTAAIPHALFSFFAFFQIIFFSLTSVTPRRTSSFLIATVQRFLHLRDTALHEDNFALQCGRRLAFHPGHLRRIIAIDEIQRLVKRNILQRIHHFTLTGKHPPFVIPDI